jgi:hypothetical protein
VQHAAIKCALNVDPCLMYPRELHLEGTHGGGIIMHPVGVALPCRRLIASEPPVIEPCVDDRLHL